MKFFKADIQMIDRDAYDAKAAEIDQLYDQGVRKNPHLTRNERKECLYWTKGRFHLNDVIHWYETLDGHTSVILNDGERVIIKTPIAGFDHIMENHSMIPFS